MFRGLTVPEWGLTIIAVCAGLVLLWLLLIVVLYVQQRRAGRDADWRSLARLAPDTVRLIRRLVVDADVPPAVRWWLIALLAYLMMPIDLVPDFLPVIGFADDAIITAVALRYAIRHAGADAVQRNWPGTAEGLRSLLALVGIKRTAGDRVGE